MRETGRQDRGQEASFDARLVLLPTSPGVYRLKDRNGKIIYIGKAKNLRQRLSSYFGARRQSSFKVEAMLEQVADFEILLCQSELEAFVLEANLIKRYQPFYNILLKDDRDYPYLCVTMQEAYPRVFKAYRVGADRAEGARYFGPYLNGDLNRAITVLHELFPIKTCKRVFPRDVGKERPCLNYHLHRCIAPCLGTTSQSDYRQLMQEVCDFLDGKYSTLLEKAKRAMEEASEALRFEEAMLWRDRIQQVEQLRAKQLAVTHYEDEMDVIGLAREGERACLIRLELREGKLNSASTHFLQVNEEDDRDLLVAFLTQYYAVAPLPKRLLLPFELGEEAEEGLWHFFEQAGLEEGALSLSLEETSEGWVNALLLGESRRQYDPRVSKESAREVMHAPASVRRRTKVRFDYPKRGDKQSLLAMAERSAKENLLRQTLRSGGRLNWMEQAWQLLEESTGLSLKRIEAFDVANHGNRDAVASMVVLEQGQFQKTAYRHYRLELPQQDDYAGMREALTRRLNRLGDAQFGGRPDLLLIDGGEQHVNLVAGLCQELKLELAVAGLVKDERHRTRGLVLKNGRVLELARFVKGESAQERLEGLDRTQAQLLLKLLTRVQDETHRFAQRYMNQLGQQRHYASGLDGIEGIGPKKRQALLEAFPSVRAISEASLIDLLERVPSLGRKAAESVVTHFEQVKKRGGSA